MGEWDELNAKLIKEIRENGGRVSAGMGPVLLITTTGAKTGLERTTPVLYTKDDGRIVIVGSQGGAPTHPAWIHNMRANPNVTVEVDGEKFVATAHIAEGAERDRLFANRVAEMPDFAEYQSRTERVIPVVTLERQE